jgi:hypothetical protein
MANIANSVDVDLSTTIATLAMLAFGSKAISPQAAVLTSNIVFFSRRGWF